MKNKQTCILVMGMHRSGTSALSGLLNILGFSAGKELMPALKNINDKGFFENKKVYELNSFELMPLLGIVWDSLIILDNNWYQDKKLDFLYKKAKAIILDEYSGLDTFTIKDPRICILFPFWERVLLDLNIDIKIVLPFRNPLEISDSLRGRDGFKQDKSLLLWAYHSLSAEYYSRNYDRLFTHYEELLSNSKKFSENILLFLNKNIDDIDDKFLQINHFLDSKLKHQNLKLNINSIDNNLVQETITVSLNLLQQDTKQLKKENDKLFSRYKMLNSFMEGEYNFKPFKNSTQSFEALQEVGFKNGEITYSAVNKIKQAAHDVAIIIHLVEIDLWSELKSCLIALKKHYDLFITIPPVFNDISLEQLLEDIPQEHSLYILENRGKDVLPFMNLLNIIGVNSYQYICKLTTQSISQQSEKNLWHKLVYTDLIGSKKIINSIVDQFEKDSEIGLICAENTLLDSREHLGKSEKSLELMANELGVEYSNRFEFVLGSMFWISAEALATITDAFKDELIFKSKSRQFDDAFEVLFGLLYSTKQYKIVENKLLDTKEQLSLIREIRHQKFIEIYQSNNKSKAQLRLDYGLGYNDNNVENKLYCKKEKKYIFDIDNVADIKELMFLPLKGSCVVKIEQPKYFLITDSNAYVVENNIYYFDSMNPWIKLVLRKQEVNVGSCFLKINADYLSTEQDANILIHELQNNKIEELYTNLNKNTNELNYAMTVVGERDKQLQEKNKEIEKSSKELGYAISVVKERGEQLQEKNNEIERSYEKLGFTISAVKDRDEQLREKNNQLEKSNKELGYTISVVKEKDEQLQEKNNEIIALQSSLEAKKFKAIVKAAIKYIKVIPIIKRIKVLITLVNKHSLSKLWFHLKNRNFELIKNKLKNKTLVVDVSKFIDIEPSKYFNSRLQNQNIKIQRPIDIIIPVYNGYEFLEPLFDSLKANTSVSYRLLVVNDASPDKKVLPLLKNLVLKHDHILIENEKNRGFVKSVNKATGYVKNHFVILNTDTEVPSNWLERLMSPIINETNVATTTPFTNAGTIASFPNFLDDNEIFENLSLKEIDDSFKLVKGKGLNVEVPTGVGFCMGINYLLFKEIGFFDEVAFEKGYGEENDWCQRAIKSGYKNVMVPNLFVYHKHGGSFSSEEKKRLIAHNYQQLLKKHPNYEKEVHSFISKDPYKELRIMLQIIILSNTDDHVELIFDHGLGGGANIYTDRRIASKLGLNVKIALVSYSFYKKHYEFSYSYKKHRFNLIFKSFNELEYFLDLIKIKEIFINELVSYPDVKDVITLIKKYKEKNKIKVVLPLHDYFILCPSYILLNNDGVFCDLPDTKICAECLNKHKGDMRIFSKERDVIKWRKMWHELLESVDEVLAFSDRSKVYFLKIYSEFNESKVTVIPHKVNSILPLKLDKKVRNKVTVGILGSINESKGAGIIKDMVDQIEKNNLDINVVVIGEINKNINSKYFYCTGRYEHKDLQNLIIKNAIDIFLIPSIWPETFSYTSEEIMMMRLPLIVFDIGAPAERVVSYKHGYIVKKINAKEVLKVIDKFNNENM